MKRFLDFILSDKVADIANLVFLWTFVFFAFVLPTIALIPYIGKMGG